MVSSILWVLISGFMVVFNYIWAVDEYKNGNKLLQHTFTAFLAFWTLMFMFDVTTLIKLIFGG